MNQPLECEQTIYHFKARDLEIPNIFAKFLCFDKEINYIFEISRSRALKCDN